MNAKKAPLNSPSSASRINYAQCWEDADVLLDALRISPGDSCLSIASAGDNSFSLLAAGAGHVISIDRNPAQLACVELRRGAYLELNHSEFLELYGSRPSKQRDQLYNRCRPLLSSNCQSFWDHRSDFIRDGIGGVGKFERFFSIFRNRLLPLVHRRSRIEQLLRPRDHDAREIFFKQKWDSWLWRLLFRFYFSRSVMGQLGRYPGSFKHVKGQVSERILERVRHAIVDLEPWKNPYLHWILTGRHGDSLPHALRPENYDLIRENLDSLETVQGSLEEFTSERVNIKFDAFNLSDVFEYVSKKEYEVLLKSLICKANPGARLAYWNMLVPRTHPASLADSLVNHSSESDRLFLKDKAFFYSQFVIEEVKEK